MGAIKAVNDADFQTEVLESSKPVLVDFWAEWCGPCKKVAPVLEELASESDAVEIRKLDIDANPEITRQFQPSFLPKSGPGVRSPNLRYRSAARSVSRQRPGFPRRRQTGPVGSAARTDTMVAIGSGRRCPPRAAWTFASLAALGSSKQTARPLPARWSQ
nr:thioredoxin domain-containing protein [Glycomyces tenuis]